MTQRFTVIKHTLVFPSGGESIAPAVLDVETQLVARVFTRAVARRILAQLRRDPSLVDHFSWRPFKESGDSHE